MEQFELDMLGVYAYADSAHARERELWRGFLSYALPVVMSSSSEVIDKYLTESIVYHVDELTVRGGNEVDFHESMRCISAQLAKEMGVPPEFAVACFFEGKLPTKFYKIKFRFNKPKKTLKAKVEDHVIAGWLEHLSALQTDNKFLNKVEKWKTWLYPLQNIKAS